MHSRLNYFSKNNENFKFYDWTSTTAKPHTNSFIHDGNADDDVVIMNY